MPVLQVEPLLARQFIFVSLENEVDSLANVLCHWNLGLLVQKLEQLILLGRYVDRRADLIARHKNCVSYADLDGASKLKRYLFLAVLIQSACANKSAVRPDSKLGDGQLAEGIRQTRQGNEVVTEFDLNNDKRADVWTYTAKVKSAEGKDVDRITRKELDINGDGKIDISRQYDEREQVQREALDLDFDGKVDQVNHYEKGIIVSKERDLTSAGKTSLWLYYEKGKLVRKERDTNLDSKIDYWEYWEGDQVDRVGEDLDGDGAVDKWTKNPNSES
jgi:antitoxin component YwqK of YwqJK toxin-antitoxin module